MKKTARRAADSDDDGHSGDDVGASRDGKKANAGEMSSSKRPRRAQRAVDPNDLDFLLQQYYGTFFPYRKFYQWLSYGNVTKNYFAQREFTFTLKDDVYVRYLSFSDDKELRTELMRKCPHKIDIGAVYNAKPRDQKTLRPGTFQPIEKELVFDIDMTDYDDVRTCCSEANICHKCWKFMTVAIKIIDQALREDFGFQTILWVYSGRRGVHCWVCDERARKLSNEGRSAVSEYLQVLKGGDQQARKVKFGGAMHPSLIRANNILRKYFDQIVLQDQNLLMKDFAKVLDPIPDPELRQKLRNKWSKSTSGTSESRWRELVFEIQDIVHQHPNHALKHCEQELMFQLCYPHLDINVSKQLNHLLKSPFCVHPKTGRVCVPIDPVSADEFDPMEVPTVEDLLEERRVFETTSTPMDGDAENEDDVTSGGDGTGPRKLAEYKKTSLKDYMDIFNVFLRKLDDGQRVSRSRDHVDDMSF